MSGHAAKQVRDNIDSADPITAFDATWRDPPRGEVFNMEGGRVANCSMLEATALCE